MSTQVPETHYCFGCESNVEGKCVERRSRFRRMFIARKRVANCRYKTLAETEVKAPQDPSLTKILDDEDAKKAFKVESVKMAIDPALKDNEAVVMSKTLTLGKMDEEPDVVVDGDPNITLGTDKPAASIHEQIVKDAIEDPDVKIVGIGIEEGPLPGDMVTDLDPAKLEAKELEKNLKESEEVAKSLTDAELEELDIDDLEIVDDDEEETKEDFKEGESSITLVNQPLASVESHVEDGSLAAGPTPPKPEVEEEPNTPTGITLHPKGEPSDGDNGSIKDKGRKFLEDAVNDIEKKTELPKNGALKEEDKVQPMLASETCSDVLTILDQSNNITEGPKGIEVDPSELFEGLEQPSEKDGQEVGLFSGTNLDGMEQTFCFNCRQMHPLAYFSPEGNVCLNCVQKELRRVLFEIRRKFFDPSAADQELLDEVLEERTKDGERLSMLETLYIARDLLQSYSPSNKARTQIQPTKEEVPLSSPFLMTCEDMEGKIRTLTWAQLQKVALKMDISVNQPIGWIAAQVCARVKKCNDCGQLKMSNT